MEVGFTGTQQGMTNLQVVVLREVLSELQPSVFKHGGAIGADLQAEHAVLSAYPDCPIRVYPAAGSPPYSLPRHGLVTVYPPMPPLKRNRIIAASPVLIGTPATYAEQRRSGTWATLRYGRTAGAKLYIIYPNGVIEHGF